MAREIKFRGLTTSGEWAFGSLVIATHGLEHKQAQHTKTWIVERAFANGGWFNIQQRKYVKPETIGQFTGLHDKNGVEIFEGDIVRDTDSKQCGTVIWDAQEVCFTSFFSDKTKYGFVVSGGKDKCLEVIGNVHQNPDLLGGEK